MDYKDWPLLKWDWIKDLCRVRSYYSGPYGYVVGVATSNFCGPQFVGCGEMWNGIND